MPSKADFKKVIITMPNNMVEYLESVGQHSRRTGGFKIAKTEIVRAMIKAMQKLEVDYQGLQGEKEIEARLQDAMRAFE